MKKFIAILLSLMMLTVAFTACGKKEDKKEGSKGNTTQSSATDSQPAEGDKAAPDQSYNDESLSGKSLDELAEIFNNSEDEEEREKARIEIQRILEQAEQQAQ